MATERGIPFTRLNTEDYLSKWQSDIALEDGACDVQITTDGKVISTQDIIGAYIRQPKLPTLDAVESDMEFSKREIGESLKSLWRNIEDSIWFNAPHKILRASNKAEQLKVAQRLGIQIPPTCISADSKVILDFFDRNNGDLVVKAVKHGFIYDGKQARVAATQKISRNDICNLGKYVKLPMIFQKRIEKQYDIRVTVVGNRVFAAAIFSQDHKETSTDWRLADHYNFTLRHERIDLPEEISDFCRDITARYGLRYSAIDLILSKDKSYYFLEMNPNGQWAWIEQVLQYPIRDAILDEMLIENEVAK